MSGISFEVNGRSYPFVPPGEATMGEARELKRLSGGMGLASLETALSDVDPDAWTAVMLVSMRRVDPTAQDSVLDDRSLMDVISAMVAALQAAKAEADAVPPPSQDSVAEPVAEPSNGATTPVLSGT